MQPAFCGGALAAQQRPAISNATGARTRACAAVGGAHNEPAARASGRLRPRAARLVRFAARPAPALFIVASSSADAPVQPSPPPAASPSVFPEHLLASPMPDETLMFLREEAVQAALSSVESGLTRSEVQVITPSLDQGSDAYHQRSTLRLAWDVVLALAATGRRVKVGIQGGGGPVVSGVRKAFENDWAASVGSADSDGVVERIRVGGIGPEFVGEADEVFVLIAPTNSRTESVVDQVMAMSKRVGDRPLLLINPRLEDLTSYNGKVMGIQGREERTAFLAQFLGGTAYYFKLLYLSGTEYPIRGVLYRKHPGPWKVYGKREGSYEVLAESSTPPTREEVADAFRTTARGGGAGGVGGSGGSLTAAAAAAAALALAIAALAASQGAGGLAP